MSAIADEIKALVAKLDAWSLAYHRDDNPIASDAEYDRELRRLRELEEANPDLLIPTSPTQRVGDKPLSEFQSIAHKLPMLSLDNAFSGEDIQAFEERNAAKLGVSELRFCCEPKLDGVALSLVYENGILKHAASRGDGTLVRTSHIMRERLLRFLCGYPWIIRRPSSRSVVRLLSLAPTLRK